MDVGMKVSIFRMFELPLYILIVILARVHENRAKNFLDQRQRAYDNVFRSCLALLGIEGWFRDKMQTWILDTLFGDEGPNLFSKQSTVWTKGKKLLDERFRFLTSDQNLIADHKWSDDELTACKELIQGSIKANPIAAILTMLQEAHDLERIFFIIFIFARDSRNLLRLSLSDWKKRKKAKRPFAVYKGQIHILNAKLFSLESFIKEDLQECWTGNKVVVDVLKKKLDKWESSFLKMEEASKEHTYVVRS
jgi:hypothetical protein